MKPRIDVRKYDTLRSALASAAQESARTGEPVIVIVDEDEQLQVVVTRIKTSR